LPSIDEEKASEYGREEKTMRLVARDDAFRYVIEAPDNCNVQMEDGILSVPDANDPATPYCLFDDLLVEAARSGEFGLRMIAEMPLNWKSKPGSCREGWDRRTTNMV